MNKIYLAELETRHFSFRIVSTNRHELEQQIKTAWEEYADSLQQGSVEPKAYDQEDWNILEMSPSVLYRDYQKV